MAEANTGKPINEAAEGMLARAREETAQVGSTVQLRSGDGPKMKVVHCNADDVVCEWVLDDVETRQTFPRAAVKVID